MRRRAFGRIETLENRWSTTGAPEVIGVLVSGSAWTSSFISFLQSNGLGNGGYGIPVGTGNQLADLPWTNINQIKIKFNRDVLVDQADLAVTGVNTTQYFSSSFSYDQSTFVATWSFSASFGKDRLLLGLNANGLDPVVDQSGNRLDGEWNNGSSTTSGNGVAGGDFLFALNVLPGDLNQSGQVLSNDTLLAQSAQFKYAGDPGYSALYDVNGSGSILSNDTLLVQSRQFNALPNGQPAGISDHPPSTRPLSSFGAGTNWPTMTFSLEHYFSDYETAPTNMSYQVTANSNPALVTANVSSGGHALTLGFSSNTGASTLTVRATDSDGLSVDNTFTIGKQAANQPPLVYDFYGTSDGYGNWTFTGRVADESAGNLTVTLGSLVSGSTISATDGTFSYATFISPGTAGTVTAQTVDSQGLVSNVDKMPIEDVT